MSGKGTTLKGITVEIGGDTTKLGDAILKARKSASSLSGELRGVESLLKLDPANTVLLAQKQDILAESIAGAKDKLKMLIAAQESMSKQLADGKISPEQYRDFEREIESTRQQLTRLEAAASGTDDAVADVGDAAEEAGEKAKKASGGWTVLKGVMADLASSAIKAAVSTVVDGAKKMVSAGLEYNQAMEGYVTNFTTMLGGSAEAANGMVGSLQKLASATPLAMSDLAGGAQTLLAFGVASDDVSGTLQRLGDISLGNADKMQSLARAYGKATAQGKLTGETVQMMIDAGWNPLIDICDQTGESMEDVQKRMAAGSISAEELTQAVNHATDAGGKFAGGMEAASKTVAGLTSTLQDNINAMLGELMQPVSDAMLSTLLPTAIDAVDQLTTAFEDEGIDGFSRVAGSLIASLSAQLVSYAPQAIPAALAFIGALVTGLLLALPDLTGTAIELVGALLLGIADQLPGIITAAMSALLGIVGKITSPESITLLIQAAMQLMLALARGLIAAIPQLIDAVPGIITNLIESFYAMLPEIIGVGIEIVIALASGLVSNAGHIVAAVPRLVETIVRGFLAAVKSYWNIGKSIVDGIRQGIVEQWQRLKSDVSNLFTGLVSWIKNLLGIHSPSRVFADIGQNMAAGIGDGWASTIGDINRQIGESLQPQYVVGVDMQGLYAQSATLQAAAAPSAGGDVAAVLERMDRLERAITGMQIYMDGDALVGSVATRMDYALGGIYTSKARRTI
nr:MAG TPA_asm: tail tape measure protein [Caudoviricetes sp.]